MSASAIPTLAKARGARRYECTLCAIRYGRDEEHVCTEEDLAEARRERREGSLPDRRHAIKVEHRPPDKLRPMTRAIADRFDRVIWRSGLSQSEKLLATSILAHLDYPTRVYFQSREFLFKKAGLEKRIGQLALLKLANRGIALRSTAGSVDEAGVLRHLHYDAHDERLIQPTKYRRFTHEWDTGMRLIEWPILEEAALITALEGGGSPMDRGDRSITGGGDQVIVGRGDQTIVGGGDRLIVGPGDQKIIPSTACDQNTLRPSLQPPTLAPSSLQGDPPNPDRPAFHSGVPSLAVLSATPSRTTAVPSPPSRGHLATSSETERPEGRESKVRTDVGAPEGSPAAAITLPPTAAELAEIGAAMAGALASGLQKWPGPLGETLTHLRRDGYAVDEIEAFVAGVVHGEGEELVARSKYAPFDYAAAAPASVSLYIAAGRKYFECGGPAPAAAERLSEIRTKAATTQIAAKMTSGELRMATAPPGMTPKEARDRFLASIGEGPAGQKGSP